MKKSKKYYLKFWIRILLFICIAFLTSIGSYLVYLAHFDGEKEVPVYFYSSNSSLKYKVHYKNNEFYEDEYIGEGKQYNAELIDYIDVDLSYLINTSKIINIRYDYQIVATIIGEYETSSDGISELWTKVYNIKTKNNNYANNTSNLNINENIRINYEEYNEVVNNFKQQFKLAIDAYLKLELKVKCSFKEESLEDETEYTDTIELDIPLTSSTLKITKNNHDYNGQITTKVKEDNEVDIMYYGVSFLTIGVVMTILLSKYIFISKKTLYIKTINKILRDYGEVIVTVSECPNLEELEVLNLVNFDDLIDTEEEIKSPILKYEYKVNYETWFIIINDNYAYKYVVSKQNLE